MFDILFHYCRALSTIKNIGLSFTPLHIGAINPFPDYNLLVLATWHMRAKDGNEKTFVMMMMTLMMMMMLVMMVMMMVMVMVMI